MRTRHTIPNDRARHPWDRPAPEPGHPATRPLRWAARLGLLALVVASLYPALGLDSEAVDLQVACAPTSVGIATECTVTITVDSAPVIMAETSSFPVRVGAYDNEQGGQPSTAEAVARAQQFDVITAGAHQYRGNVAAMKAANPNLHLQVYVNGTHTRDGALPEAQYCHDAAGSRITTNGLWSGNILMNPANAGWRTTLLATVNDALARSGYDGVFIDVLGRGALQYNVTGSCIDPRTGSAYTAADWERDTSELARSIKERSARPVVANGASRGVIYFSSPRSSVIAQYVDGGLAEGFTRNGALFEGYYTESALLRDVAMVADAPVMHVLTKDWRAVSQDVKDQEMRYAFATFLLGTNGNDVFGWTGSRGALTGFDPLWNTDLGTPKGSYYQTGTGTYRRDFARGHVLVDAGAHTGSIVVAAADDDHTVTWTSSGDGTFDASACTSDGGSTTTCQVRYTPGAGSAGPHTITAVDASETGSGAVSASTSITVNRRASATTVACTSPVAATDASTCTATVSDTNGGDASAPTGPVTFSSTGGGSLGATECSLAAISGSKSTCSVTYRPTVEGDHAITGAFGGDADHKPSSSAPAVVVVEPTVVLDVTAPVVQILSPADGSSIKKGRTIKVVATATDDVGVTNVEFAADGVVKCRDVETTAMTCAWSVPRNGSTGFTVTVTAWDEAGNVGSQQIQIAIVSGRP